MAANDNTTRVHIPLNDYVTAVCEVDRERYIVAGANTALTFQVVELIAPKKVTEEEPW